MNNYQLQYLPSFEKDLTETVMYISNKLNNPKSALDLVNKVEAAILKRVNNPTIFAPFPSVKQRPTPYYSIQVGNYYVFYVVVGDVMEVRRLIYSRRNIENILP